MNDFKVGDRVKYVATRMTRSPDHEGHEGVVTEIIDADAVRVQWDDDSIYNRGGYLADNLRLVTPAPDVLTIPRAELPEVVERDGFMVAGGQYFGTFLNAAQHRAHALAQLAASEFLAAREKAEQDAADQHAAILNKRRDELAKEFRTMEAIIDYAIQLEGQVKK